MLSEQTAEKHGTNSWCLPADFYLKVSHLAREASKQQLSEVCQQNIILPATLHTTTVYQTKQMQESPLPNRTECVMGNYLCTSTLLSSRLVLSYYVFTSCLYFLFNFLSFYNEVIKIMTTHY